MPRTRFEDIIDGYFPLEVSVAQMMDRLGAGCATVQITHAPIMHIPGLPPEAPVPLNIRAGRAGLIAHLRLTVISRAGSVRLGGAGAWRWLDGTPAGDRLDPATRLAEPAFVWGAWAAEPDALGQDMREETQWIARTQ